LFYEDTVLVPGPASWMTDASVTFEVLLASARANLSGSTGLNGVVERIPVDAAVVHSLRDHPDVTLVVLTLTHASKHQPHRGALIQSDQVSEEIDAGQNAWSVLEQLGIIPDGIRTRPVARVLGPVAEWEQRKREHLVKYRQTASVRSIVSKCCCKPNAPCHCPNCPLPWW